MSGFLCIILVLIWGNFVFISHFQLAGDDVGAHLCCQWQLLFAQGWVPGLPWQQAHHLSVTERFVFITVWKCDWAPQGVPSSP